MDPADPMTHPCRELLVRTPDGREVEFENQPMLQDRIAAGEVVRGSKLYLPDTDEWVAVESVPAYAAFFVLRDAHAQWDAAAERWSR